MARDIPIIFSGPMVRALLAGRKTETRRLATSPLANIRPGDRLWVREAVRATEDPDTFDRYVEYVADGATAKSADYGDNSSDAFGNWWKLLAYRATDPDLDGGKIVPSIHMPQWASRITLVAADLKIVRLRDISEREALAEGIMEMQPRNPKDGMRYFGYPGDDGKRQATAARAFGRLWASLHNKPDQRWEDNPMVAALSFTVHRAHITTLA